MTPDDRRVGCTKETWVLLASRQASTRPCSHLNSFLHAQGPVVQTGTCWHRRTVLAAHSTAHEASPAHTCSERSSSGEDCSMGPITAPYFQGTSSEGGKNSLSTSSRCSRGSIRAEARDGRGVTPMLTAISVAEELRAQASFAGLHMFLSAHFKQHSHFAEHACYCWWTFHLCSSSPTQQATLWVQAGASRSSRTTEGMKHSN